jgi:hypothetical protein
MELKKYQVELLKGIKVYLSALAKEQAGGNKHAALDAWEGGSEPSLRTFQFQTTANRC